MTVIKSTMPPALSAVCVTCKHLTIATVARCAAFPKDIPQEIWLGRFDHTRPFPGDNGIQFEQIENNDE